MSTVNKEIADKVVEHNGIYPGDRMRIVEIIKYKNIFDGGDAYRLIYEYQNRELILESPAILSPETYWKYEPSSQNS
jgi:hypothetical protein